MTLNFLVVMSCEGLDVCHFFMLHLQPTKQNCFINNLIPGFNFFIIAIFFFYINVLRWGVKNKVCIQIFSGWHDLNIMLWNMNWYVWDEVTLDWPNPPSQDMCFLMYLYITYLLHLSVVFKSDAPARFMWKILVISIRIQNLVKLLLFLVWPQKL